MKTTELFFGVGAVPLRVELNILCGRFRPATQGEYLA
jgi:hypothetical protein